MKTLLTGRLAPWLALLAGSLLPFAFAPFQQWWLALLCPILLLISWQNASAKQAAWRGWLFGLGMFGIGTSWIFISIHTFGETSIWLAGFITALFVMTLALFPSLQGYLLKRYYLPQQLIWTFPGSWIILEWLRSHLFTGFPWLLLGYSLVNSPLHGYAPLFGDLGLSLVALISSVLLYQLLWQRQPWRLRTIWLLSIWLLAIAANHITWGKMAQPLSVALVQGNIPQQLKWSDAEVAPTLERYATLSRPYWGSDLIIWPETAIPIMPDEASDFLAALDQVGKQHHSTIVTGIPLSNNQHFYNGLLMLGQHQGVYYKQHLVPFGEYIPLQDWLGDLLQFLDIPQSDFSAGSAQQPKLMLGQWQVAAYICYEIAYAELLKQELPSANLIITISNDAWFGRSFAAAQHLQIAQMRALENARYLLFVTNTGVTAIIKPDGQIQAQLPEFTTAVLTGTIQAMTGSTPLQWWQDKWLIIILVVLVITAWKVRQKRKRSDHPN